MDPIIVEKDNNKINGNTEDDHNSDSQVTVDLDNSNGNANLNQAAATNSTTNKPVGNYKAQVSQTYVKNLSKPLHKSKNLKILKYKA